MVKKRKKNIFIVIFIIILLIIICFLTNKSYLFSEAHFYPYPYIDTKFSKDFSWKKFNSIKHGMSQTHVMDILGEPISKNMSRTEKVSNIECWQYSTDSKAWPYADFSYYLIQVCFEDNAVESKPISEFRN